MKSYPFSYSWRIHSAGTPRQLWPYVSDTNRFFKDVGQLPVQEAMISHSLPRHFAQLEYDHLRRADIWQEEPYRWEAPHYLKVYRNYQRGPYEELLIKIELIPDRNKKEPGTDISIQFEGISRGFMGSLRTKTHFSKAFKQRLKHVIRRYDESIASHQFPQKKTSSLLLSLKNPGKWRELQKKLTAESNEPELSRRIIDLLHYSDEQDLKSIEPLVLSKLWSFPLHRVLETAYHAVILNILNMEWRQVCPRCRRTLKVSRRLFEISTSHYCNHCGDTMDLDLNNTTQIIFKSHPLVRKLSDDMYCVSGPQHRPHVVMQQYIKPGAKHFVNLMLPDGKYRVRTDTLDRDIHVRPDVEGLDNVTMTLEQGEKDNGETLLSPQSDMIVKNKADHPLLISIEDRRWQDYGVSAAEVTSQQFFRECFPKEYLRESQKMKCDELTVLFTDLIDSSSIYSDSGDEEAIKKVMDHFEVLRKIIREERGAIVKTIGDAIMAVFRQPASAVRAYQRAQKLFFDSDKSDAPIRLKGGLHHGSCYAVTLNNRIDYFGNTVNLAARLVEKANRDELVLSSKVLENPHLQTLLDQDDMFCKIDSFSSKLKGFGDQNHAIKRLSLHKPALKLVI
ncbi:adenylate/guanylate cyclase domain-containing protein [Rhodohalobacter sp. 8-1]|uniref:adenylate/guanylate cyclase domain-containing protein n=1 Tax=Rhodohalobacter sp. 8-1 TaxID=3131972 RepID=UPI0030EEBFCB